MNTQEYDPLAIKLGRHEWMSLRDYFAAQALVGILAMPHSQWPPEGTARRCYVIADAMLTERDRVKT